MLLCVRKVTAKKHSPSCVLPLLLYITSGNSQLSHTQGHSLCTGCRSRQIIDVPLFSGSNKSNVVVAIPPPHWARKHF